MAPPRKQAGEPAADAKAAPRKRGRKKAEQPEPEHQTDQSTSDAAVAGSAAASRATAEQPDSAASSSEHEGGLAFGVDQMVSFYLNGQRYSLPIGSVQEIQQIVAFSEVPGNSATVVGMVNLRGRVIPAVDMRALLGMESGEYTLETPMILVRHGDGVVALIVDEVEDVLPMPEEGLQPPPAMHSLSDRMMGVCRLDAELIYMLDVDKLLSPITGLA